MPISVEEQIDSRTSTEDGPRRTTTRLFLVNTTQDAALNVVGVPVYEQPLPWDEDQIVVNRVAVRKPNSTGGALAYSLVTIVYSTDGGTSWGGGNPADPSFLTRSFASYEVEVSVPFAFRNPVGYRYPSLNGQTLTVDSYDRDVEVHWETRTKQVREIRLQNVTLATCEQIAAKSNRLHKMGGLWYRFIVGEMREVSRNVWHTTYSWEYDPGTPDVYPPWDNFLRFPRLEGTPTGTLFPSTLYTGPNDLFARPPFCSYYMLPGFDPGPPPVPHWPKFRIKLDFQVDENGWQALPGMIL